MGAPFFAAIHSDLGWEFYDSRAGAYSFPENLATMESSDLLASIRAESRLPSEPAPWQEAHYAEGGILIDMPSRTLVWFGACYLDCLPRILNHLAQRHWPGWTILWSPEAAWGLLRVAGVDPMTLLHPSDFIPTTLSSTPADLTPWEKWHGCSPITVRLSSEQPPVTWESYFFLDLLASMGPEAFRNLAIEVTERMPKEQGQWNAMRDDDETPSGGAIVDFCERSVTWWSVWESSAHVMTFQSLWPGWTVTCLGDDYGRHEALLGRQIRTWHTDVTEFLETTTRNARSRHRWEVALEALGASQDRATALLGDNVKQPLPPARCVTAASTPIRHLGPPQ